MSENSNVERDRQMILDAEAKGGAAKWLCFVKLSGPGWLQSAITLGGASLSSALFLGILGGFSLLWLQIVAIVMGVIMLSAISYVTLSTGKKPFQAINEHINPALGWGWAIATATANMLWTMPQFGLSFEAITECIIPSIDGKVDSTKYMISFFLFIAALFAIWLNHKGGKASKAFDWFLKALVGMVVVSFVGVVIYTSVKTGLPWGDILSGFIPDISQWNDPTAQLQKQLAEISAEYKTYWHEMIIKNQRDVMISALAAAVGINMTFLMPYSMLQRGWDKTFRGLARFDLATGMAIPFVLVTSCVVISASTQFHVNPDKNLLSKDVAVMEKSDVYKVVYGQVDKKSNKFKKGSLYKRAEKEYEFVNEGKKFDELAEKDRKQIVANLPIADKTVASTLVKRKSSKLSEALAPLLGKGMANYVFGIGVLGMGFSTIVILMLINGFVICEMLGQKQGSKWHFIGCAAAGVTGMLWPAVFTGDAKMWLAIMVSAFGMMLLPIAYITFMFMMNSKSLMGNEKPTGSSLITWNVLMGVSTLGAIIAAGSAVYVKSSHPIVGPLVMWTGAIYLVLIVIGFIKKKKSVTNN